MAQPGSPIELQPAGDSAIVVDTHLAPSPSTSALVAAMRDAIERARPTGLIEVSCAFTSLLVTYDPCAQDFVGLYGELVRVVEGVEPPPPTRGRLVELPVCYDAPYAPDLPDVATHAGLEEDEVVRLHTACECFCGMVGFLPGFAYLGGMDDRIACPRMAEPRLRVERGSVGIAGSQTGIYPLPSPGGWRIIGRTPIATYDPSRSEPSLLRVGDRVRFVPIDADEFERASRGGGRWTSV